MQSLQQTSKRETFCPRDLDSLFFIVESNITPYLLVDLYFWVAYVH